MISLKDDPEGFPVRQLTILGEYSCASISTLLLY
jgi:hypothetical protein